MTLEIIIWDVNHGNSISAKMPNGNVMMLDCAANPITEFSPIWKTKKRWGHLNLLIVSHPHIDHISDIFNIDYLKPKMFLAPDVPHRQLREGKYGEFRDIIEKYIEFSNGYKPLQQSELSSRSFGDEAEIFYFGLDGYQEDINNYSLVTFLTYGGFTFVYAGDLTSKGWEWLIDQEGSEFTRMLRKTNFFAVSHHERKEGFNPMIFDYMRNLKMAFVSDKQYQTTSITSWYSQQCEGWQVTNENFDSMEHRKVLTTRSDGRIRIEVNQRNDTTEVGVKTFNHYL